MTRKRESTTTRPRIAYVIGESVLKLVETYLLIPATTISITPYDAIGCMGGEGGLCDVTVFKKKVTLPLRYFGGTAPGVSSFKTEDCTSSACTSVLSQRARTDDWTHRMTRATAITPKNPIPAADQALSQKEFDSAGEEGGGAEGEL